MGHTLNEIAQNLKNATHIRRAVTERVSEVKAQLIYAFNGTGKTRLSTEFKKLMAPEHAENGEEQEIETQKNFLYYNAFTEDLFYWDNDLEADTIRKLKIQSNSFTDWLLRVQGQGRNVITNFQHYTSDKLTPYFNEQYTITDNDRNIVVKAYSEVTFSIDRGDDNNIENIKISKGEESCFIWSVFYSLVEQVIETLNIPEPEDRDTDQFDSLKYIFIDDPVSSLDNTHLIELAVNIASLIKSSQSELKFIITTHNPLFFNVLHNEFRGSKFKKYFLKKLDNGEYDLTPQRSDSPFSYHLSLISELDKAIESGAIHKYHFNFLRNILEKTATFLGYDNWSELLPGNQGERDSYHARIINISSHSKHHGEEVSALDERDKRVLGFLVDKIKTSCNFKRDDS